ncbi:glycosyltransferase family 2 protein [Bifidobacterium sp.]|uniref:glycosyltransferase family 2 protein n=1 Tax=unclassified Bifidobacterium TaxID=2608897 RepID=UPI002A920DFF|nr:glycosyltransferase [Bifidobacterium sp.]MDY5368324.1 glycosyltransferase [Bifidobacterium sp.]
MHDNQSTEVFSETSICPAPTEQATQNPLVTIILPVYNVAKWLDTCIQSVVEQTYHNLQIILVDDGSTDEAPTICEHWAAKDRRINVVHQQNAGLSAARNTGLRLRKGEYVCFVDSDDYVEHDYVQRMLDTALAKQADMVVCNVRKEDENGNAPTEETDPDFETKTLTSRQYMFYAMHLCWKHWKPIVAWNKLYRSEIWDDLTYPVGKINEDEFVFAQLVVRCRRVACINDVLYHYVQHDDSITNKKYSIRNLDKIEALCQRFLFLDENGFAECLPDILDFILKNFVVAEKNLRGDMQARQRLQSLSIRGRKFCLICLQQPSSLLQKIKFLFCLASSPLAYAKFVNRLRHR